MERNSPQINPAGALDMVRKLVAGHSDILMRFAPISLPIKQKLARTLRFAVPRLMALRAMHITRRGHRAKFWRRQCVCAAEIYGNGPILVQTGPFKGMKYINESVWGPIEPKWIGCYEQELHQVMNHIIGHNYETIIDIGSAEGYYSVGLAVRIPSANVFSYEIDPWSRAQQKRLATLNGVENLRIKGVCSAPEIDHVSQGRTLVVCDIEGSEFELMAPAKSVSLLAADVLVEVHSFAGLSMAEVGHEISARFAASHRVSQFSAEARLPRLVNGAGPDIADEHRLNGQVWLWMQAM